MLQITFGFLLHDTARLLRRDFERRSKGTGLTRAQWAVLAYVARNEGSNQAALADMLDIEPITLVRLLDKLEAAGLVERRPDPADRRASPLDYSAAALPPTLLITAGLDALRDQGRAYAAKLVEAGVPTVFREAKGTVHGYICLAKGIPSSQDDIREGLATLKAMVAEAVG